MSFRTLTDVERVDTDRFELRVDAGSFIVRGPNGGYIAAVLTRALQARVDDFGEGTTMRPPRSLTIHYPAAPTIGPAVITTDVVRAGRSLVTVGARLLQDDEPMAVALAAFSPPWPADEWTDEAMPTAPSPDEATNQRPGDRPQLPFTAYWDHRFTKGLDVDAYGPAEIEGWIRLAEPEPIDAAVVAAMTDAFPPAVFTRSDTPNPVPTVDLTIHFRTGVPSGGFDPNLWVLGRFRTRTISDGFLEENGDLWTADGRLLAQSRQLAIVLPG